MAPFTKRLLKQIEDKCVVEVVKSTIPRRTKENSIVDEVKATIINKNLQNAVDRPVGNTLLHYAAKSRNSVITQFLLELGNEVNIQNRYGKTPLILAVEKECCEDNVQNGCCKDTVEILINAGASVLIEDKHGSNALKTCGSKKLCAEKEIMEMILRNCDFPNDNEKIADKLLEYEWPLIKVVLLRNADLTKLYLDRKYPRDIDEVDDNFFGRTALHIATQIAHAENVKLLLSYDARIISAGVDNLKPLAFVYYNDISIYANERLEILKMFLEREDNLINMEGNIDKNVVGLLRQGSKEAIQLLLQTGLDLSAVDESGDTVVHLLARNENPGVIESLHGRNFDPNAHNDRKQTPLIVAASCGIPNAVEFLLQVGANIEAVDDDDLTALFRAICDCAALFEAKNTLKYRDCFQILLELGANTQLVNSVGESDLTILEEYFTCYSEQYLLYELVLSHFALQEALGTPITQLYRSQIDSQERFKTYFELSQQVLTDKIYQSITLLDLLIGSERKLESYVRNQDFCLILNAFSEECEFYYFKTILKKRISKAIRRMSNGL